MTTPVTDLDALEALIQRQRPAQTPWVAVTDYSFEARRVSEGRHPQVIQEVFHPGLVLDCGAGTVCWIRNGVTETNGVLNSESNRNRESRFASRTCRRWRPSVYQIER